MISKTTVRFRAALKALPLNVQRQATSAFLSDPKHPSLHYKKVHTNQPVYSARVSKNCRSVGIVDNDTIVWFWIGTHADYEELLKRI